MNARLVAKNLGLFLIVLSGFMAACGGLSWVWAFQDADHETWAFEALLLAAGAGLLAGGVAWFASRGASKHLGRREAVMLVPLTWIVGSLHAALPYWFWGLLSGDGHPDESLDSFVSCFFEAMSGLTTCGATIIPDVESMPHALVLWRAITQWLGGVGIVVLFVAVLPSLGVGGKRLFQTESTGPAPEGLRPHVRETARILWFIYVVLTLITAGTFAACGLGPFDAACHAFTTVSTGGFSTRNASLAAFENPALEWAATLFMFLSGVSFGLYFLVLRKGPRRLLRDPELKLYASLVGGAVALCTLLLWWRAEPIVLVSGAELQPTLLESLRSAAFTVVSITTTTGFGTADFDYWPVAAIAVLMFLAFCGGCAGSTAGGIKVIRILIGFRLIQSEIEREHRPSVVRPIKVGGSVVDSVLKLDVAAVLLAAVMLQVVGTALLMVLEQGGGIDGHGIDFTTAASATLVSLFNVGPGLGDAGASETYSWFRPESQAFLSALMLLGRLEIFAVLVLFTKRFWVAD